VTMPKETPKALRFDEKNLSKNKLLSTAQLQSLKGELDGLTKILATGKATPLEKGNAEVLNSFLAEATLARTTAEKAKKVDTVALVADMMKKKAALSAKLESLKNEAMDDEERSRVKRDCSKLKDAIKDSMEITACRAKLEKRTEAKIGIETHVKNNLESARRARKIVLCFMMDCTGSMQSCIDEVKTKIHEVAAKFADLYSEGSIHYAFVGYRDFGDEEPFLLLDFVDDVTELQDYVKEIKASGGGDEAEDVVGGLNKAKELNWDVAGPGSSRILIHIADAPPHGSFYHGESVGDDYADKDTPNGTEGKNATPPLRYLKAKHVHYFFCPPPGHTCSRMVEAFNERVNAYVEMKQLDEVHQLSDTVLKTLSTSVMRTVASGRSALTHSLSTICPITEEDEDDQRSSIAEPINVESFSRSEVKFTSLPTQTIKVFQIKPPYAVSSLRSPFVSIVCQVMHNGRDATTVMKWDQKPFAKGSVRWAFYGQVKHDTEFQPYVMKRFQGARHARSSYMQGIEESSIAQFLAEQYNFHKKPGCKPIRHIPAYVLEIQQMPAEYLFGEAQLPGYPFQKWANNAGDWDLSMIDQSLLEFAKFSYDATEGFIMVSDLQGVDTGHEFVLTDPVLLCKDVTKYHPTNLGPLAMKANYEKIQVLLAKFI